MTAQIRRDGPGQYPSFRETRFPGGILKARTNRNQPTVSGSRGSCAKQSSDNTTEALMLVMRALMDRSLALGSIPRRPPSGTASGIPSTVMAPYSPALRGVCACTDCDRMLPGEDVSQATASQAGYHLHPYGDPGLPALGGDASSTPFNGVRRECFNCCQPRQFATASAGCHRVDLRRLSVRSPESGPAVDRIPGIARCGFGIPPASFLPG
jgi:hypothetical protein